MIISTFSIPLPTKYSYAIAIAISLISLSPPCIPMSSVTSH